MSESENIDRERDAFEGWWIGNVAMSAELTSIKNRREGDGYGWRNIPINLAWKSWEARSRIAAQQEQSK